MDLANVDRSPSGRRRRGPAGALLLTVGFALAVTACGASTGTALEDVALTSSPVDDATASSTTAPSTTASSTTVSEVRVQALKATTAVPGLTSNEARCMVEELDRAENAAATDDLVDLVSGFDDSAEWDEAAPDELDAHDRIVDAAATCLSETRVLNRIVLSTVTGGFTAEESRCYAQKRIAAVGKAEAFRSEFTMVRTADDTGDLVDVIMSCADIRVPFASGLVSEGIGQTQADCVARRLPDADLRALLVAALAGEDPEAVLADVMPHLSAAFTACGVRNGAVGA